ncbi:TPA: calcium-binding protein [Candidatus Uhrbacteria bacterium]|nr:calcium-binding protein [Candidatus Uhrbacteria bacterium]
MSNIHDKDQDGLTDLLEVFYGTNAENSDTDGDGQTDGEEVLQGTNPRGKGSLFGFGLESL